MDYTDDEILAMSDLERAFVTFWAQYCRGVADIPTIHLEYEYKFHPERKWRLDFAHPDTKVGVEVHGGIWTQGRHVQGRGFEMDREKVAHALDKGWVVFELTKSMIENFLYMGFILAAIRRREALLKRLR